MLVSHADNEATIPVKDTLSLDFKRSGAKLETTSLSTGVFKQTLLRNSRLAGDIT